jgi:DNA-binding transcriptional regulator GbsR (MarR family)
MVAAVVTANSGSALKEMTIDDMENELMHTRNTKMGTLRSRLHGMVAMAVFQLLVVGCAQAGFAQGSEPKTFSSPTEACQALNQAVKNEDEQGVDAILGTGKEVSTSNDEAEDKLEHERFSQKYEEMHRLVQEADGRTILYIGAENWPFPIPLVSSKGTWHFDSNAGKQEILFRTIGENEATAIQVCEEFAMANTERDVKATSEDPITQFAERLTRTGAASPDSKEPSLFHGYYFRIVKQSSAAAASAGGRKTRGLTLVSYPARYQSSGVMTFVVTKRGLVYENDLGPGTATVAPQLKARTGSKWHPAV